MKEFTDAQGGRWLASAREDSAKGVDYKGRVYLVIEPADASRGGVLELPEVRWNNERTAARTIASMSTFELRRRLRSALARVEGRRAS